MLVSTLPAPVDLQLYPGDDFSLTLTVTNPDGSAANLTGMTISAQVRLTPTSPAILATFGSSVAANVITLTLANTITTDLPAAAVWDCQMTSSGGNITTLAAGALTTVAQVTRP